MSPRFRSIFIAIVALLAIATTVRADGKFFGPERAVSPTIPDQRALVVWDLTHETLVIDTAVSGDATDLAWIVPVPAVPEITEVGSGLFPTLESLTAPTVRPYRGEGGFIAFLVFCTLVVVAALLVPLETPARPWLAFLGVVLLLVLVGALMLPALATARGTGNVASAFTPLSSQRVGAFETLVFSADDAVGLPEWLAEHGYAVEPGALQAIDGYIRDQWVFVATRLATDSQSERVRPHPIALRFPTAAPVYPMRLTGVGNGPLSLELIVLGPAQASIAGLRPQLCLPCTSRPSVQRLAPSRDSVLLDQPDLARLAPGAVACTHFRAVLQPSDQGADLAIGWTEPVMGRPVVYTRSAVRGTSAILALGVLLAGGLALVPWRLKRKPSVRRTIVALKLVIIAAVAVGVTWGLTRTVVATRPISMRAVLQQPVLLSDALNEKLIQTIGDRPPTLEEAVAAFGAVAADGRLVNPFTGERVRLEASPGNCVLRHGTNGRIELLTFDAEGRPGKPHSIFD